MWAICLEGPFLSIPFSLAKMLAWLSVMIGLMMSLLCPQQPVEPEAGTLESSNCDHWPRVSQMGCHTDMLTACHLKSTTECTKLCKWSLLNLLNRSNGTQMCKMWLFASGVYVLHFGVLCFALRMLPTMALQQASFPFQWHNSGLAPQGVPSQADSFLPYNSGSQTLWLSFVSSTI